MRKLTLVLTLFVGLRCWSSVALADPPPPQSEPAYYDGSVVWVLAFSVPQNPEVLGHATADFYSMQYPPALLPFLPTPMCNPCTHNGFTSYHDHVIDSIPSGGGGEYSPIWHLFRIVPNYTGDPAHNAIVNAAYIASLPLKSEAAIDAFVAAGFAREVDTGTYFMCPVVSPNATP